MKTETKARVWAMAGTLVIVLLLLLIFFTLKLAASPEPAQKIEGNIALAEDFIEVIDHAPAPLLPGDDPAAAMGDPDAQAQPAPEAGSDPANAGDPGAAKPPVASDSPSPHQETKPTKTGPTKQEQQQQQDQRQAQDEVANAFGNSSGRHNTQAGDKDQADAGRAETSTREGSYNGSATGNAGGGWGIPAYSPVRSTVTGEIRLKVTIDQQGRPAKAEIIGGTAPASTNSAVRSACLAEVRRHTFTRPSADDAPETAIAIITYSFK